jgi:hypothetical protein
MPPQSKLMDELMGSVLDRVLLQDLLSNYSQSRKDWRILDLCEEVLDQMVLRMLLNELNK